MIELSEIRALLAVEQHGSVGAAAAALGFTPSAVSQQIKRLERSLGSPLLERVGRGVVLTPQGRFVAAEGQRLAYDLEGLGARLHQHEEKLQGVFRLAAFSTAVRGVVAPLVAAYARENPALDLTVLERDPAEAIQALTSGHVEMAVVHNWVGVPLRWPSELRSQWLFEDYADVIVHAGDPLAARTTVTPEDLLDHAWTSTEPGAMCHRWFEHMFAGMPQAPQVRFWSWEYATQIAVVAEGLAIALVPRLGRGQLPDNVVALPVRAPRPTREVYAVWRPSLDSSPALRHTVATLAAYAAPES